MDEVEYGHLAKEQLESMKVPELKQLAADMGIEITADMKKSDIVEAIAAVEVEIPEEAEETEITILSEEDPEDETEEAPKDETQEAPEEGTESLDNVKRIRVSYVGPTLPGGMMNHGKILQGTEQSIADYLCPILERYPQVAHLMVPTEKLQKAMRDVKNPKKLLYQYAESLKHEINVRKRGEQI